MKRILLIIRSCKRDDFIARLCYDSWIDVLPDADYLFFLENGEYKYVPKDVQVSYRRSCDNFGGRANAVPFIEDLKKIDTKPYDFICVCDADVIMYKNPFDNDYDFNFGGWGDDNNPRHFSGQLMIWKRDLFNSVVKFPFIEDAVNEMIKKGISIADDTILSYIATMFTEDVFRFNGLEYWVHEKRYDLEPK